MHCHRRIRRVHRRCPPPDGLFFLRRLYTSFFRLLLLPQVPHTEQFHPVQYYVHKKHSQARLSPPFLLFCAPASQNTLGSEIIAVFVDKIRRQGESLGPSKAV